MLWGVPPPRECTPRRARRLSRQAERVRLETGRCTVAGGEASASPRSAPSLPRCSLKGRRSRWGGRAVCSGGSCSCDSADGVTKPTRYLQYLHPVEKGRWDSGGGVGGSDEEDVRQVEGRVDVVVGEGAVLRRVQHLRRMNRGAEGWWGGIRNMEAGGVAEAGGEGEAGGMALRRDGWRQGGSGAGEMKGGVDAPRGVPRRGQSGRHGTACRSRREG